MILSTDKRYKNIPLFVMQLDTTTDNLNFLDGDIAVAAALTNNENILDLIDDNDFLVLKGGAGTKNDYHIVKVNLNSEKLLFSATSSFVSDLPITEIRIDKIRQAPIVAKILFTISNKTTNKIKFQITNGFYNPDSKEITEEAVLLSFPERKS